MLGGLLAYGSGYSAGSYMNLGSGTFHLFSNYEALAIQTGGVNKPIVFGTNTNNDITITFNATSNGQFEVAAQSSKALIQAPGLVIGAQPKVSEQKPSVIIWYCSTHTSLA